MKRFGQVLFVLSIMLSFGFSESISAQSYVSVDDAYTILSAERSQLSAAPVDGIAPVSAATQTSVANFKLSYISNLKKEISAQGAVGPAVNALQSTITAKVGSRSDLYDAMVDVNALLEL